MGKTVKESKKRVTWQFCFGGDDSVHTIVLTHSIVSGKRKIEMDGRIVFEQKKLGDRLAEMVSPNRSGCYDHSWHVPGHLLRVSIQERFEGFIYGKECYVLDFALHTLL